MTSIDNIILIGMPGSGKSTVGIILAKLMAKDIVDTDILIQHSQHRSLQDIVDHEGHHALREIEQQVLMDIDLHDYIISTGGSAVYSKAAMEHLKSSGTVVFLNVGLPELEERIHNFDTRGLAKRHDQTFEDLYNERLPLYRKYADITIDAGHKTQDEVAEEIQEKLLEQ